VDGHTGASIAVLHDVQVGVNFRKTGVWPSPCMMLWCHG